MGTTHGRAGGGANAPLPPRRPAVPVVSDSVSAAARAFFPSPPSAAASACWRHLFAGAAEFDWSSRVGRLRVARAVSRPSQSASAAAYHSDAEGASDTEGGGAAALSAAGGRRAPKRRARAMREWVEKRVAIASCELDLRIWSLHHFSADRRAVVLPRDYEDGSTIFFAVTAPGQLGELLLEHCGKPLDSLRTFPVPCAAALSRPETAGQEYDDVWRVLREEHDIDLRLVEADDFADAAVLRARYVRSRSSLRCARALLTCTASRVVAGLRISRGAGSCWGRRAALARWGASRR